MVSWGEILLTVTAASYLLGRKELPKLGRFVGLYSGRSVGAIIRAKQEFFDATRDHEIVKLQREFQRGLNELNEIRSELTSVGNMSRPHQPVGSVESAQEKAARPAVAAAQAAAPFTPSMLKAAGGSGSSVTPLNTTSDGIRPSVASPEYIAALSDKNVQRSEVASLALAELKLAERGSYATRIESLEGGADYVAASIVDSLLLEPVGGPKPSAAAQKGKPEQ
ncbi:hypothetical protein Poli38472_009511 [Pythium oligandrum]|uniref:Uncharacterized protein n=1 Tax=Pythium oligandrum TaxID=41045 RepID=A0A8K1CGC7_PYTOL|nr:hypothetical protein Poli38472_009511 [Pythium oligandrum]|eukprot:TMW62018.1 hypothetical protein Poli38472_009511 [Pythium oligandrum]